MFAMQPAGAAVEWDGLAVQALPETVDAVSEDLAIWMSEHPDGMTLRFTYATDLFDAVTIERLSQRYARLLDSIVQQPQQRIAELPLLLPAEVQALREWNDTPAPLDASANLVQGLSQRLRAHASHDAIISATRTLTAGELASRVNRLAQAMAGRGVGVGDRVGLCLQRSADLVAAQLAVLWTGAAYVPLDPAYPADRLHYMADDASLALVLTDTVSRETWAWKSDRTLCLEENEALIAA